MKNRSELITCIAEYATSFTEEQEFLLQFNTLLKEENCFLRSRLQGHITGSAWIVNKARNKAVLVHHKKLNRWLQPGGHADGDENIVQVCEKEAQEETGLKTLHYTGTSIFDLDIHTIPERKEVPEHLHYDIRVLFEAEEEEKPLISEESTSVQWIPFEEIPDKTGNNSSILRMMQKSTIK